MNALSDEALLELWRTSENMEERDRILIQMKERNIYPQDEVNTLEEEGGLYPSTEDPLFLQKLLRKQEFAENKQMSVLESIRRGIDPCKGGKGFELSPTQRFIGQFLSFKTPYMSALLFHGVGVGKTCSAITVAESYLEQFPRKQVIIVAPRNIQPNFSREIFSETKLKIGEDEEPNEYMGCTGNTYLKLTGMEYNRDPAVIMNRVNALKSKRYQLIGYLAFYNYIRDVLDREVSKTLKGERRSQEEMKVLSKKFSNRLIIIDEAHNVRDLSEAEEEVSDAPGGKAELNESMAGKKLTPYLRKLLAAAEGTKLLLLTATPMYNSYREIIPILNLLLINDKKVPVSESDFFDAEGNFLEDGERKLGTLLQAYVSFMRGENPLAFPIRLEPEDLPRLTVWPTKNPLSSPLEDAKVREQIVNLPFVKTEYSEEGLRAYLSVVKRLLATSGLRLGATDGLVQAGNFLFPGGAGSPAITRIREQGFKGCFSETKEPRQFRFNPGIPTNWLHESQLASYSPKSQTIVKRLRTTEGVTFIYSRFVFSGALGIALVLEANGYENAVRSTGYLKDVPLAPGGKQCALCPRKQDEHAGADHTFKQAKYILLTGRDDLTPNNKGAIELATKLENKDGALVKVVIGSQVASEGIDLKFIREVLVFDSWYHLNKLEQVIGRGIRFCSHAAFPVDFKSGDLGKRNCTVVLLLTCFPDAQDQETIDMYQYRIGFEKAKLIGKITRVMKQYAIDCNLNRDAVLITGLDDVSVRDSQGQERYPVSINDVDYTAMCDWIEGCDYECGTEVVIDPRNLDDSTYDEYAARWRAYQVKERLKALFERQPSYKYDKLILSLTDIPRVAIAAILSDIVGNRSFRMKVRGETGYILYKNGYYLFQPERLLDTGIPLALRTALFPVKQDSYEEIEPARKAAPAPAAVPGAAVEEKKDDAVSIPAAEIRGDIQAFWTALTPFFDSIQEGTLANARSDKKILPDSIQYALKNRYVGNKKAEEKAYSTLSMIHRFYQDIKENNDWRERLMYAAAKLVWDELLNIEEQYALYKSLKDDPPALLSIVWDDHILMFDDVVIYRRVNPATGLMEYKCDGENCSPALVSAIEAEDESTDELRKLRVNNVTTGKPYGTVNYKNGLFVFKTNVPVKPSTTGAREKQERGSECGNVPNMIPHYALLEELGKIGTTTLGTNFGFTEGELQKAQAPRGVKNQIRACALTDIALRFMDEMNLETKRWFYRPLPTFYTKHPGILRKKGA